MRSHKPPSRATSTSSIVPAASRSFPSRNGLTRRATFREKLLRPRSLFPPKPAPFTRQMLTQDLLTTRTPEAHEKAVKEFATLPQRGPVCAHRPESGDSRLSLLSGRRRMGWAGGGSHARRDLCECKRGGVCSWPDGEQADGSTGERIYHNQCSLCHGKDLAGSPPLYPSLVDVGKRLSPATD